VLSLAVLNTALEGQATVDVTLDIGREIGESQALLWRHPRRNEVPRPLLVANGAFQNGETESGIAALEEFETVVQTRVLPDIMTTQAAGIILAKLDRLLSCAR
jgi:hypothetical protein